VAVAADIEVTPDVVYGHKYGMALTFDVLTPVDGNGAAVLRMESGGWRSSWRPTEDSIDRYQALLDHGFTVFAVRHGSSPKFVIPEIVPDVRRAVRFIRLHARDFGIDPNRVGVWGGSARGHLSLVLGTASDSGDPSAEDPVLRTGNGVAAVVAYYPPVDLRQIARGEDPDIGNERFPAVGFVSADDPPTLLIHCDQDGLVNIRHSHQMYEALQADGIESKLIIIEGAGHGFRGADAERATAAMVDWFERHLAAEH
jgi:acetyl esterase/lipase